MPCTSLCQGLVEILIRDIYEDESQAAGAEGGWTLEALPDLAERFGVRAEFEEIRTGLLDRGYQTLQKKYGLNFNPGTKRQAFWVSPREQAIHVGYLDWNLDALYNLDQAWAEEHLGDNWIDLPPAQARDRVLRWTDTIRDHTVAATPTSWGTAEPPAHPRDHDSRCRTPGLPPWSSHRGRARGPGAGPR